jgi:hypothetical protein
MATATKKPSTAVAVKKNTGVVSVADIMTKMQEMLAADAQKIAPSGGNAIRVTQDKQFLLPDGSKTPGPLEVVIVDFTSMNTFYENDFDKNNIVPPNCFSIGNIPTRMVPSANSPDKQCDDCNNCPMAAWGSGKNGGKACKNSRVLAVLPPDATSDTPLWILKTSPTAIKDFDGYVKNVQRMFGVPPVGVVTTIGFDDSQTYARLTFGDPVPNENVGVHLDRVDEAQEMLAVEPDVSGFAQDAAPARKATPMRRAPAVARR